MQMNWLVAHPLARALPFSPVVGERVGLFYPRPHHALSHFGTPRKIIFREIAERLDLGITIVLDTVHRAAPPAGAVSVVPYPSRAARRWGCSALSQLIPMVPRVHAPQSRVNLGLYHPDLLSQVAFAVAYRSSLTRSSVLRLFFGSTDLQFFGCSLVHPIFNSSVAS